jgi:flagellar biosynthesis chaperone FliJ
MAAANKSCMRIKPAIAASGLIFLLLVLFADVTSRAEEVKKDANQQSVRRKPIEKVQLISFNLAGGQRISGKVVSEDPYQIEIDEIRGSKILLTTYSRSDIDKNSVVYKPVSELDYWRDTGKYFLQKVWDFQDDPDEYMQAIRCYQKARTVAEEAVGADHKLVTELDEKIDQIQKEMTNWAEQVKSRAELRKLEVLSTFDVRMQKIQEQINANTEDIGTIHQELANNAAAAGDYDELRNKIASDELAIQLLQQRLLKFENEIDTLWQWYGGYQPRYYIAPRGMREPNSRP